VQRTLLTINSTDSASAARHLNPGFRCRRFEPAPAPRERIDVEERVLCRLECEVCRLGFRGRGCGWGMTSTRTDGVDAGAGIESVSGAGVGGVSRGALLSMSMGYWCAERNVNASERGWSRVCC